TQQNKLEKVDYVVGASFLVSKEVLDTIGLLPEDYFLYYEDADYCYKAKQYGFKLGVALDSIVYHKEGGTTKANNPKKRSKYVDELYISNKIKFHKKYLGGGFGLFCSLMISKFLRKIRNL
ncbi:MAG: hypothetical protein N2Z20_02690, partial [Elusimicrobiales bacterium]|nr:hypothetical protein [Elusimicrobiales bacterium]